MREEWENVRGSADTEDGEEAGGGDASHAGAEIHSPVMKTIVRQPMEVPGTAHVD